MTGAAKIRATAMRILGRMDAFKAGFAAPGTTDGLGVYDAPGGPGPVWITASALLVPEGHELQALHYVHMREIHAPDSKDKTTSDFGRVRLVLDDGTTRLLMIVGGRGRFCDSFEFARFLARASKLAREEAAE
jgi:hypothetical protein